MKTHHLFFIICFFVFQTSFAQENGLIHTFKGFQTGIYAVAMSADGKYVTAGGGNEIKVWAMESKKEIISKKTYQNNVMALAVNDENNAIYSAGGYDANNNFKLWSIENGNVWADFKGQEAITAIRAIQNNMIVSGALDKTVKIWKSNGELTNNYLGHQEYIFDVDASVIGNYYKTWVVIGAGGNLKTKKGEIIVWDRFEEKILFKLTNHSHCINSVDISPNGENFVSAAEDGTLKIWDLNKGTEIKNLTEPYTQITKVRYSPDGKYIAVASKDQSIKLFEVSSGKKAFSYKGHFKEVTNIAFSADGKYLLSSSLDQTVKLWRATPYKRVIELFVQEKLNAWQQKGKFEKTVDYQNRISDDNKQKNIEKWMQEAMQNIAKEKIDWTAQKSDYDADNETFRLIFRDFEPVYLKVPLKEAELFDKYFKNLQYRNPIFTLTSQGDIALLHLEISNPANGKVYPYNSQTLLAFNTQDLNLSNETIELQANDFKNKNNTQNQTRKQGISDVDFGIPKTKMMNPNAIAVVIGNAQYLKTKSVDFAIQDARAIKSYLIDAMGYQPANIIYLENASLSELKMVFGDKGNPKGKLYNSLKPNQSDVFIFYSGHGAPGLNDKKAYFVPAECDPQYVELTGYPTDVFYDNLAQLPAKSVVVTLDACFSGENIYENISPIVIKSKGALGLKNGALIASSNGDQVSAWYNEKGHGLFTYFFLKAIHNQNADFNRDKKLTLQEIYFYINSETEGIPYQARRLHGIQQNPVLKGQDLDKVLVAYE